MLEMLRSYFGITEDLHPHAARTRIEERVLAVDPRLATTELPLVFEFLAVPDPDRPLGMIDPEARRRRLLELIRRLVHDPRRDHVVVHAIEDAHWIDPASDEFLATVIEATAGSRTLVLVTFRPEYAAGWTRRSWYRQLPLSPLAPTVATDLLTELLGSDPSLDGLAEPIVARTGGNPFFLEEVVRDLAETGTLAGGPGGYQLAGEVSQVAIPDTVQAVLAARIDRLGHQAKGVIAAGAVIGRQFDRDLLERVAQLAPAELDSELQRLGEAELIAQTEVYPTAGYAFRHPLTHEVALGALLSERRRELHRRAALAILELNPDPPGEVAALIAQHAQQAGQVLEACTWHLTAATWAMVNDLSAAVRHLDQVRVLDRELPDGAESDRVRATARAQLLAIGFRAGANLTQLRAIFEESVEAATRARDDRLLAQVQVAFVFCVMNTGGQLDEAADLATAAVQTVRRSGDLELAAAVQAAAMYPYLHALRLPDVLHATETVLELTTDEPDLGAGLALESPRGFALPWRSLALAVVGGTSEALAAMNQAYEFLRGHRLKETLSWAAYLRLLTLRAAGVAIGETEVEIASEACELAEAIGGQFVKLGAHNALGGTYLGAGRGPEALEHTSRAIGLLKTSDVGHLEAIVRPLHSLALTATGDPVGGMAEAELAIRRCAESGNRYYRPQSCAAFAIAAATAGTKLDRALEVLDDGERVVAETGARGLLPELLEARARVHAARGEHEALCETLRRGLQVAIENQAQGWEKRFEDALAGALGTIGHEHE
jgi:adenylate cyclase